MGCQVCHSDLVGVGPDLGVCPECVRQRWAESEPLFSEIHARSRRHFQLPLEPPASPQGLECSLCMHRCRMDEDQVGYCGIRSGTARSLRLDGRERAKVSCYLDPLPTNCVADWVCPGGSGSGFPTYAHQPGPEVGYHNLAVFFESCNLNCLYCQNWHFKGNCDRLPWQSVADLARRVTTRTSCVCYFGGDPTPQLPYAIRVSKRMREEHPGRILRICWETNASMHPAWLTPMVRLSLESGGCIKVDLKAWHSSTHKALCGFDNRQVLDNFVRLARLSQERPTPPLLVASTLLVPGYVAEEEVAHLAGFIADLNPDIPYALLAFAPQFELARFPTTSRRQAEVCMEAAQRAGLRKVRLANQHLLCH